MENTRKGYVFTRVGDEDICHGIFLSGITLIFSGIGDVPAYRMVRISSRQVGSKLNIYERIMAWGNDLPYLEDHDAIFDLV
jgi:hypothetical protein